MQFNKLTIVGPRETTPKLVIDRLLDGTFGIVEIIRGCNLTRADAEAIADFLTDPTSAPASPKSPDFDGAADLLTEIETILTEEIDSALFVGSVPGKPETILEDKDGRQDYALRVIRFSDLGRRVRELRAELPVA